MVKQHLIKHNSRGFTLIELLVTLIVSLILIAIGVPGMTTLIQNNRLTSASNQMLTDLSKARSRAIKSGQQVSLCPANNNLTGCNGSNWEAGWLVFIDLNQDDTLDTGEEIILARSHRKKVTIRGNTNLTTRACFSPRGVACNPGTFFVCDARMDPANARGVALARTGRVHVTKQGLSCPS